MDPATQWESQRVRIASVPKTESRWGGSRENLSFDERPMLYAAALHVFTLNPSGIREIQSPRIMEKAMQPIAASQKADEIQQNERNACKRREGKKIGLRRKCILLLKSNWGGVKDTYTVAQLAGFVRLANQALARHAIAGSNWVRDDTVFAHTLWLFKKRLQVWNDVERLFSYFWHISIYLSMADALQDLTSLLESSATLLV